MLDNCNTFLQTKLKVKLGTILDASCCGYLHMCKTALKCILHYFVKKNKTEGNFIAILELLLLLIIRLSCSMSKIRQRSY